MRGKSNLELSRQLDALVKSGQLVKARQMMSQIEIKKIPRSEKAALSAIARRLELFNLSLRILSPVVRSNNPLLDPPTDDELLEYGAALFKIGAVQEARRLLMTIDPGRKLETLLYQAMSFITEWNYPEAIPLLEAFIDREEETSYRRKVAQVNLVSSLIFVDRTERADRLLETLREATKASGFHLLHGNCLELSAILEFTRHDYAKAERYLTEALQLLGKTNSISELYINKWLLICRAFRAGSLPEGWGIVRSTALNRHDWEIVRDMDFYEGWLTRNEGKLLHCYFGSPYPAYRENLLRTLPFDLEVPDSYLLRGPDLDSGAGSTELILDLETGSVGRAAEPLSTGSHPHFFLMLLNKDFYKPVDVVSAFNAIHPDEDLNPETSPSRIHQLSNRLRKWLKENELPIDLQTIDGRYRLVLRKGIAIRIPEVMPPFHSQTLLFRQLEKLVGETEFSAKQCREALDISFGSMNQLLSWALEQEKIKKLKSNSKTKYHIKK